MMRRSSKHTFEIPTRPVQHDFYRAAVLLRDIGKHTSIGCGIIVAAILTIGAPADAQQVNPPIASIETLIRSRQYEQARQEIQSQLRTTPVDARLWTLDGIVFSIQGSTPEALAAFDKALHYAPNYPAALKGESELYYRAHDPRAIPLLEAIVKANPHDETAHEMLAVLDARENKCQAADEHFLLSQQAINNHPSSLEAYGSCLMQAALYQNAIGAFEKLVALMPAKTYPKYDLAVALVAAKQDAAAIQILTPLLASDPSDPQILSLASDAYEKMGETPKAVALLRQAIVLQPTNPDFYISFAALCLDHESFQVGIDVINAGLQHIPQEPSLYISRGLLHAQLAQYDEAEADFKTAESLDRGQSVSAYATDLAELQRNNPDNALVQVRSQLQAHPESALLHYLLAKLLSTQGSDTDRKTFLEAEKEALLAVKLQPDLTEARDLLATMYSQNEQYSLAITQCRLALQSNANDQTAIYHLLIALRHIGKADQRDEIQELVKRLAELQKNSRQKETDRKRFKFEEQQSAP